MAIDQNFVRGLNAERGVKPRERVAFLHTERNEIDNPIVNPVAETEMHSMPAFEANARSLELPATKTEVGTKKKGTWIDRTFDTETIPAVIGGLLSGGNRLAKWGFKHPIAALLRLTSLALIVGGAFLHIPLLVPFGYFALLGFIFRFFLSDLLTAKGKDQAGVVAWLATLGGIADVASALITGVSLTWWAEAGAAGAGWLAVRDSNNRGKAYGEQEL